MSESPEDFGAFEWGEAWGNMSLTEEAVPRDPNKCTFCESVFMDDQPRVICYGGAKHSEARSFHEICAAALNPPLEPNDWHHWDCNVCIGAKTEVVSPPQGALQSHVTLSDGGDSEGGREVPEDSPYATQWKARNFLGIIKAAWDVEKHVRENSNLDSIEYEIFQSTSFQILASTEDKILEPLLCGNLQRSKYLEDSPGSKHHGNTVGKMLRSMKEESKNSVRRPAHYLMELVDDKGRAPTPEQWEEILYWVEQYLIDVDFVIEIDRASCSRRTTFDPNVCRMGEHRWLPSGNSRKQVKKFIEAGRAYAAQFRGEARKHPMPIPPREVGYSDQAKDRIHQHIKRWSSNYIMNLVDIICQVKFNERFKIKGEVIFPCFYPGQAIIGEILWTTVTLANSDTGIGMSHHPAGGSNQSARPDEILKKGGQPLKWQVQTWKRSPFQENERRELVRIEADIQEKRDLLQSLEKLKVQEAELDADLRLSMNMQRSVYRSILDGLDDIEQSVDAALGSSE